MDNVDEAMSRYARGDATAFGAVYDAVAPQLSRYLRPRVRDETRLEDIVQQTFLQMHHARGNFVRDPAAHWAMGRALWLNGRDHESFGELQRSLDLSPNFALGHYTLGFVHSQSGDPRLALDATGLSCRLSPFDPLQFAMFATRAIAHLRLGEPEEAVAWALKAARCPNAHAHILAIAVECLSLVNRRDQARQLAARIRERAPAYNVDHLLRAFHFDRDTETLLHRSARTIGFDS